MELTSIASTLWRMKLTSIFTCSGSSAGEYHQKNRAKNPTKITATTWHNILRKKTMVGDKGERMVKEAGRITDGSAGGQGNSS